MQLFFGLKWVYSSVKQFFCKTFTRNIKTNMMLLRYIIEKNYRENETYVFLLMSIAAQLTVLMQKLEAEVQIPLRTIDEGKNEVSDCPTESFKPETSGIRRGRLAAILAFCL